MALNFKRNIMSTKINILIVGCSLTVKVKRLNELIGNLLTKDKLITRTAHLKQLDSKIAYHLIK